MTLYPLKRALRVQVVVPLATVLVLLWYVFYPGTQWARRNYDSKTSETRKAQLGRNPSDHSQNVADPKQEFFSGTCTPNKTFMKFNSSYKLTALASFPGTGDTLIRHLLEELTGYYTGSDNVDPTLIQRGFRGEGRVDGTVVAVRTSRYRGKKQVKYRRILLTLRSPFHTFLAEFNRQLSGLDSKSYLDHFKREWARFFTKHAVYYKYFHEYWFSRYKPMYVIDYDNLKTEPREEVNRIVSFLGFSVSEERVKCVAQKLEAAYSSETNVKQFDPYMDEMKEILNDLMTNAVKMRNGTFWEDPVWVKASDWA